MNTSARKAINWNEPSNQFYNDIFIKQSEQFWLPEEIPVTDDKSQWDALDPVIKEAYERVLAGLTLLDTEQTTGITQVAEQSSNLFVKSILTFFAGFEAIHARSYSTIFQTLCTTERIDELFEWIEETRELQSKIRYILQSYQSITDTESLFLSMVGSLCLEGICFYSGFYLPLFLAGQGKMVNSGEIINLILRDEKLHTIGVGFFAQELLAEMSEDQKGVMIQQAQEMMLHVYELELKYSALIYEGLDFLPEVQTYLQFNVDYSFGCLGLEPHFEVLASDVNAIVMNGQSTETKTHDFFSVKGNGYIKTTKVEELTDLDWDF